MWYIRTPERMDSSQITGALIHHGQSFGKTLHSTKRSTKIHPEQIVLIALDFYLPKFKLHSDMLLRCIVFPKVSSL